MESDDLVGALNALNLLLESNLENYYREDIRRLNKRCSYFSWGKELNLLIISDRGAGRVTGLWEYLHEKTDFTSIKIVQSLAEAQEYIQLVVPDIVIFVGIQNNKENYRIIEDIREKKQIVFPAMYAAQDNYVEKECEKYGICCIGDCRLPTDVFMKTIKSGYLLNLKIENGQLKTASPKPELKQSFLKRFFEKSGVFD